MEDLFRINYTNLTSRQKELGTEIKLKAEELLKLIKESDKHSLEHERLNKIAITHLESCVMFAVKSAYTELKW